MWQNLDSYECIFCDRIILRHHGRIQKAMKTTSDVKISRIREILEIDSSDYKLSQIQDATSIFHHQRCLAKNEHKIFYKDRVCKGKKANGINNWAIRRVAHDKSFAEVKKFVVQKLVEGREVHALRDIFQLYLSLFDEECINHPPKSTHSTCTRQFLGEKLLADIPGLTKTVFKNRTFLHRTDLSISELLSEGVKDEKEFLSQIKSLAFRIRSTVMRQEKCQLPKHNISVENIYEGECEIPIEL